MFEFWALKVGMGLYSRVPLIKGIKVEQTHI